MRERAAFAPAPDAPGLARRTVLDWLGGRVDGVVLEDAILLVSELVTNAVRHPNARGRIEMAVELAKGRVLVEVTDPGGGFAKPQVGEPPPESPGGRGLLIVDRVASRWGVREGRPTRVWFELAG